jgi:hypothetical protein
LKKLEENLGLNQTLTFIDYKENITVPIGPIETQSGWFQKRNITVLGMQTIYVDTNGIHRKLIRTVLSNNLNHDALFTDYCLEDVSSHNNFIYIIFVF